MPDSDHLEKIASVLLVDDDPDDLFALSVALESPNLNLVKAESGKEALRCLLKQDFAVIVMDVLMPGMNGFETAGLIRQREKSRHTPLIFLTGFQPEQMSYIPGYGDFSAQVLCKPISSQVLREKIEECIRLDQPHRQRGCLNPNFGNGHAFP